MPLNSDIDSAETVSFIVYNHKGEEKIIGIGRCVQLKARLPERAAEVVLAVDYEHQRPGVCTILFKHSGFKLKIYAMDGVKHIEFSI